MKTTAVNKTARTMILAEKLSTDTETTIAAITPKIVPKTLA